MISIEGNANVIVDPNTLEILQTLTLNKFFYKPILSSLQGAMMTVAFKEGLKIPPPAMNEIILAASQDIRQVSVCNMNGRVAFKILCASLQTLVILFSLCV